MLSKGSPLPWIAEFCSHPLHLSSVILQAFCCCWPQDLCLQQNVHTSVDSCFFFFNTVLFLHPMSYQPILAPFKKPGWTSPPPTTQLEERLICALEWYQCFYMSEWSLYLTTTEGGQVFWTITAVWKGWGWTLWGRDIRFYYTRCSLIQTRKRVRARSEWWTYCANCSLFSHCRLKRSN